MHSDLTHAPNPSRPYYSGNKQTPLATRSTTKGLLHAQILHPTSHLPASKGLQPTLYRHRHSHSRFSYCEATQVYVAVDTLFRPFDREQDRGVRVRTWRANIVPSNSLPNPSSPHYSDNIISASSTYCEAVQACITADVLFELFDGEENNVGMRTPCCTVTESIRDIDEFFHIYSQLDQRTPPTPCKTFFAQSRHPPKASSPHYHIA
jgi:hypothetical protein